MPSSDYSASLRASLGRLSLMHDDVLSMAREMRAIYSAETMHKHLVVRAEAIGAPVCWEKEDLAAYFMADCPEPLLPAIREILPPPKEVVAALPRLLLEEDRNASFELSEGKLRLVTRGSDAPCSQWVSELGECADTRCACYRPTNPHVRRAFRATLLSLVRSPTPARPRLRYVSMGAGSLLYDLELLLALRRRHGADCIDLVVAIDKRYCFDGTAVARLQSLLGPSTEVHAFFDAESYIKSAARHPETFADADIYVQVDCDDVDDESALVVVAAALAPGGTALVLRGDGTTFDLLRSRPIAAAAKDGCCVT